MTQLTIILKRLIAKPQKTYLHNLASLPGYHTDVLVQQLVSSSPF